MTLAAVLKARQRRQSGALSASGKEGGKEQLQPGTISISGTNYECAVHLGKVEYRMDAESGNWKAWQTLTATVKKSLMPTAPAKKTVVVFKSVNYKVDDVGGQNSTDLVWILKADRKLPSPS